MAYRAIDDHARAVRLGQADVGVQASFAPTRTPWQGRADRRVRWEARAMMCGKQMFVYKGTVVVVDARPGDGDGVSGITRL